MSLFLGIPGSKGPSARGAGDPEAAGYASSSYAAAFSGFAEPLALPRSAGWLLERDIPGTPYRDAMGCYPLFACADWSGLPLDLEDLAGKLVSVVLVTDPFGTFEPRDLEGAFPGRVTPFKDHLIVDLARPLSSLGTAHHRRNTRKALGALAVEHDCPPDELREDWLRLYDQLIARHGIRGIAAFSRDSLSRQLEVPGLVALRALRAAETVGIMLWYLRGDVAYYHLAAYSAEGYRHRASFALVWRAIELLAARGVRWLSLGAGAGVEANLADGLTRFKRGWATTTRTAYLCGRICDPERYAELTAATGTERAAWFPAYRAAAAD
jgi:hypothetical protein